MNKFLPEIEKACNELQNRASRKKAIAVREAEAYYAGYIQGTEELLEQIKDKIEEAETHKEDQQWPQV